MKKLLLAFVVFSSVTWGCSCLASTVKDNFQNAEVVFIGQVQSVELVGKQFTSISNFGGPFQHTVTTFVVKQGIKEIKEGDLVRIHGVVALGYKISCGGDIHFSKDEGWLIFANLEKAQTFYKRAPASGRVLISRLCSNTINLANEYSRMVLKDLDEVLGKK